MRRNAGRRFTAATSESSAGLVVLRSRSSPAVRREQPAIDRRDPDVIRGIPLLTIDRKAVILAEPLEPLARVGLRRAVVVPTRTVEFNPHAGIPPRARDCFHAGRRARPFDRLLGKSPRRLIARRANRRRLDSTATVVDRLVG